MRKDFFYKLLGVSLLVLINGHDARCGLNDDEEKIPSSSRPITLINENDEKIKMSLSLAEKNMEDGNYSSAFRNFLYVMSSGSYSVDDFNSTQEQEKEAVRHYTSVLVNSLGSRLLHPILLDNIYLSRLVSYNYVYTLWKSNKEGLNKESTLGKALETCFEIKQVEEFLSRACSPKERSKISEQSKDWIYQ